MNDIQTILGPSLLSFHIFLFYRVPCISGLVALEDGVTNVEVTVPINTVIEWQGTQYNTGETITITLNTRYRTAVISSLLGDLTGMTLLQVLLFLRVLLSPVLHSLQKILSTLADSNPA